MIGVEVWERTDLGGYRRSVTADFLGWPGVLDEVDPEGRSVSMRVTFSDGSMLMVGPDGSLVTGPEQVPR